MNFLELAEKRYSVRDYADKNEEEEKLKKILATAHAAPTAANLQPVRLLVLHLLSIHLHHIQPNVLPTQPQNMYHN